MNTIGTNKQIAFVADAINLDHDLPGGIRKLGDPGPCMKPDPITCSRGVHQNLEQVTTMNVVVREAIRLYCGVTQRRRHDGAARIPLPGLGPLGQKTGRGKRSLKSESVQDSRAVWRHLNARTRFREGVGLLEYLDVMAVVRKAQSGRHAANTTTRHENLHHHPAVSF